MLDQQPVAGHSARLLRGLIWAGVLLAPLAAAVVLLGGSSNSVRFAVVLIAVSLVLIGASVLIRTDPVLQRMDVEDRVAEEIASLRRELRAEFGRGPEEAYAVPIGPVHPDPAFGAGGRASVPVAAAVAAVRPVPGPNPGVPGLSSGGPGLNSGGMGVGPGVVGAANAPRGPRPSGASPRRPTGPGLASGARPPIQAPGAPIPRQRGAAAASSSPRGAAAASPSPRGAVPASPRGAVPASPRGAVPASPRGAVPASPRGAVPASPRGAVPASPRGAVPASSHQGAPRPAAAARPAAGRPGVVQYGRAEALDADFGASDGYAGLNAEPTAQAVVNTYGSPVGDGYDQPDDAYGPVAENGYDQPDGTYGPAAEKGYDQPDEAYDPAADDYEQAGQLSGDYPEIYPDGGHPDIDYADGSYGDSGHADSGYGDDYPDDPDGHEVGPGQPPTGHEGADPQYRARRHRPSANDTNIGTLADFASFDGYGEPLPDEHYVDPSDQGGAGHRR